MHSLMVIKHRKDDHSDEVKHHDHDSKRVEHVEHMESVAAIHHRLKNHPPTWDAYGTSKSDLMAIISMEYQELMQAKASGDDEAIEKEACDLAAACVRLYESL